MKGPLGSGTIQSRNPMLERQKKGAQWRRPRSSGERTDKLLAKPDGLEWPGNEVSKRGRSDEHYVCETREVRDETVHRVNRDKASQWLLTR